MVSAIAQLMVDNGFDSQDTNLTTLKDNLSDTMTNITKTFMTTGERYDNNDNWVIKDLGIHIWNSDSIVNKPEQQNPYSNGYCFMGTTWNNMLIQWGEYSFLQLTEYYIAQGNCKVTLHLPYTRNYQIITCDSGQACYSCGARQIDKTSFYIYCRRKLDGNVQQESDASVYDGILRWYTIGMG